VTTSGEAPAPLRGLRVVDLSQNLAGPYATQILGDLGADVVKVEPPAGDPARRWGPPFVRGESPLYLSANRNKRSVVLDLKAELDRRALGALAARADVFVQAFRPGVIERLGFDYSRVSEDNPAVLYLSVSAYGAEGPARSLPGYDPLMQAQAGIMSVTGHPGGDPARVGTSIVDLATGTWGAVAVLSALRERDRTGEGRHLRVSLLDSSLAWMAYHLQGYAATGESPGRMGTGIGMIAPYQALPTATGDLMIAAGNDAIFRRLCDALELAELADDPRYRTNEGRVAHRDELEARLTARTREEPRERLLAVLREHRVPCAPVQDVEEVMRDRQVAATGMLRTVPLREDSGEDGPVEATTGARGSGGRPAPGGWLDVALPLLWGEGRAELRRTPPRLGEHTEEVLAEVGLA